MSGSADALRRPYPGVAVAAVVAATALTAARWPLVQPSAAPLFFAAVVVSSWSERAAVVAALAGRAGGAA